LNKKTIIGQCKLTGQKGKFVKSHIIPKALTRPEEPGLPLMESSDGTGNRRKWDSWYDQKLVIRKGENFLRDIDTSAILELRKQQLLWSAFPDNGLESIDRFEGYETHGIRELNEVKADIIWLFIASIAWRASASEMQEMRYFKLSEKIEEDLRKCIINSEAKFENFPTSLIQLSTVGIKHNHTPTLDMKSNPSVGGSEPIEVPFARIFVESLICHFHISENANQDFDNNPVFVGSTENLIVTCIDYEVSDQKVRIEKRNEIVFSNLSP
jgi:hypothetical protein